MLHSTCPSERLNGTTGIAPRTLEDLMKRCTLLKPKLDSHYFREIGDNPFHSLFRGTNQEIILTKYAHESSSPSSLYQPPPSAHTGLSTQLLSPDETELWDGDAPGTQIESPRLSATAEKSQTHTNTDEYSSEYEHSGSESDSDLLMISSAETESQSININGISPHHSANSNLITGGNMTDPHTEYNANRASPDFKPKRIKLTKTQKVKLNQPNASNSKKSTQLVSNLRIFKRWTVQDEKLLAIGVSKYGHDWRRISATLNFSCYRSQKALSKKFHRIKWEGKWTIYMNEFRNKVLPMKKANRVRKLIIDQSKAMTNETIRAQISCYADTLHQKRAFPPISSHAILLKARTLLVSPAIAINPDWLTGPILDVFNSNFGRISTPTPLPPIGIPTIHSYLL